MISDASIKKLLKKAGALRVSKLAIQELKKHVEEEILLVSRKAVKNAEYSGRKSIKKEDIEEAIKQEEEYGI
jgi:histone H3/H4